MRDILTPKSKWDHWEFVTLGYRSIQTQNVIIFPGSILSFPTLKPEFLVISLRAPKYLLIVIISLYSNLTINELGAVTNSYSRGLVNRMPPME